ncbi:MAG: hypothetical protein OXT65_09645 [Alphaproteobacteria bacterium]|nr:hypothetical protein [Alphaproteobacteria bacterium]
MKRWIARYNHPDNWFFTITYVVEFDSINREDWPLYYLHVFDAEKNLIFDYLQDEFEAATEQAMEKWGVPEDSWDEVREGEVVPEK